MRVGSGMVRVVMGVQQEFDGLIADRLEFRHQRRRKGGELIID